MFPLVEFCVNNLTDEVLAVKKKLEENREIDVLEYGCLGNCGLCAEKPYALVDGEIVSAETGDELLEKILKAIEEMEVRY
ncbi:YuzB family protein [Staphylospora marina]|uniref:YuzB family protein n=1 Tax=Staphylospora marina TaxID=2490858 RepID=UPI000F5BE2A4|nr:YuzB family protein [Staphylospora marina]